MLVVNRGSGHRQDELRDAEKGLARANIHVTEQIDIKQVGKLQAVLTEDSDALIIAAGGDGTVGSVVEYVARTEATLGILPLGTSNDVARSLGIPMAIRSAIEVIAAGHEMAVDVGELRSDGHHSRYFLHAAAIGLNVGFARFATRSSLRRRLGRFTYLAAAYLALRHRKPFNCELELDGECLQLCLLHLSIVNAPVFGGFLGLRIPGSEINDRMLDVVAVEDQPLWQLLPRMLVSVVIRDSPAGVLRIFHVRRVAVRPHAYLDVSLDGEICAGVPGEFVTLAHSLRVLCPRRTGVLGAVSRGSSPLQSPESAWKDT